MKVCAAVERAVWLSKYARKIQWLDGAMKNLVALTLKNDDVIVAPSLQECVAVARKAQQAAPVPESEG